jgi:hypothetical protein
MGEHVILLIVALVLYTYIAVAVTVWSENSRLFDIVTMAALMSVWPVALPVGYLYGAIRLRIKYKKYRGGRYVRKTFNQAAIDAHIAKYGS